MSGKITCSVAWAFSQRQQRGETRTLSGHLANLSDEALSLLYTQLVDEHDAHRERVYRTGGKVGRRVDPVLREYFAAVKVEMLTREPHRHVKATPPRYESRRPVNVLKRAVDNNVSQGTVSLGDLQAEYWRVRR